MRLCRLVVGGAEDDVFFADGRAVEIAFGLKGKLHPRGVSIHQGCRGVRQMGHRQRSIEHDPDRDDGNDRRWNRNLGDDSDIAESWQHFISPVRRRLMSTAQTLRTRGIFFHLRRTAGLSRQLFRQKNP